MGGDRWMPDGAKPSTRRGKFVATKSFAGSLGFPTAREACAGENGALFLAIPGDAGAPARASRSDRLKCRCVDLYWKACLTATGSLSTYHSLSRPATSKKWVSAQDERFAGLNAVVQRHGCRFNRAGQGSAFAAARSATLSAKHGTKGADARV